MLCLPASLPCLSLPACSLAAGQREAIAALDHAGRPVLACSASGRSISAVWPQLRAYAVYCLAPTGTWEVVDRGEPPAALAPSLLLALQAGGQAGGRERASAGTVLPGRVHVHAPTSACLTKWTLWWFPPGLACSACRLGQQCGVEQHLSYVRRHLRWGPACLPACPPARLPAWPHRGQSRVTSAPSMLFVPCCRHRSPRPLPAVAHCARHPHCCCPQCPTSPLRSPKRRRASLAAAAARRRRSSSSRRRRLRRRRAPRRRAPQWRCMR